MTMHQKNECADFLIHAQQQQKNLEKKLKFDHSLVYIFSSSKK